ncbi:hypothetical protein C4K39_2954 [Pseudomonas sessilinigenes]|nr:hypothetical protein C4K39_2954 [Pseudomonas sessilinigenes]
MGRGDSQKALRALSQPSKLGSGYRPVLCVAAAAGCARARSGRKVGAVVDR